jgi:hypothetical protein
MFVCGCDYSWISQPRVPHFSLVLREVGSTTVTRSCVGGRPRPPKLIRPFTQSNSVATFC